MFNSIVRWRIVSTICLGCEFVYPPLRQDVISPVIGRVQTCNVVVMFGNIQLYWIFNCSQLTDTVKTIQIFLDLCQIAFVVAYCVCVNSYELGNPCLVFKQISEFVYSILELYLTLGVFPKHSILFGEYLPCLGISNKLVSHNLVEGHGVSLEQLCQFVVDCPHGQSTVNQSVPDVVYVCVCQGRFSNVLFVVSIYYLEYTLKANDG